MPDTYFQDARSHIKMNTVFHKDKIYFVKHFSEEVLTYKL